MQLSLWPTLWAAFLLITLFTLWTLRSHKETRNSVMVADRTVDVWLGAAAIAAAWTQAAAVYASGLYAAMSPWHFAMFAIPNVAAVLLLVAPYMSSRRLVPEGITLGHYMDEVYGPLVRTLITMMQLGIVIVSCVGSLLAIQQWLTPLLGIQPGNIGLIFGAFAIVWVILTGLKGGLVADRVKVFCLGVLVVGVVYLWWRNWGAFLPKPVYTKSTEPLSHILWDTGVPLTVTLIGAVFCFPDIAERANALVKSPQAQRKAIVGAALLFAFLVVAFGSMGALASYTITEKYDVFPIFEVLKKTEMHNLFVVASVLLAVVLTAGLAAYVASFGSLLSIELFERYHLSDRGVRPTDAQTVWVSRFFMLILIPVSVYIATRPGLTLPKLLEYSAAFRGEAIFPVLAAPVLLYFGLPTRAYDKWIGAGMLAALLYGGLCVFSKALFGETSFLAMNARALGALCAFFLPAVAFCLCHFFVRPHEKLHLQSAQ